MESCLVVQGENYNVDLKLETSVNASDVVDSLWMKEGRSFASSCSQRLQEKPSICFPNYFWASIKKFVILLRNLLELVCSHLVHIFFFL